MIFQYMWQQVLDGTKTQTRRIVKPGEVLRFDPNPVYNAVHHMGGHAKWQTGNTYAVQPGRTQKAIARIEITAIRQERVQDISDEDVIAEGVVVWKWALWQVESPFAAGYAELWDSIHTSKGMRWSDNPLVWVIEFRLMQP